MEPPPTLEVAKRLVDEFAELDGAQQAVVTARRQVEILQPARDAYQRSLVIAWDNGWSITGSAARRGHLVIDCIPYPCSINWI